MPPVRIMRIITRLNVGSPAMHAVLLAQKFTAPDYESQLVCGTPHPGLGDMGYYARSHGVEPVYVPELSDSLDPLTTARAIRRLMALMRDYQPDIVHTHMARAGFLGRVAAWRAGVPVIVHTYHGHVYAGDFNPVSTQVFKMLERFAANRSDTILVLTQSQRRELAETYHIARQGRMTILPLGLDFEPFMQRARHSGDFRAEFDIPPDAPLIGIVGHIAPVKNLPLFLKMAALVHAQRPAAHFAVVGDGEDRPQIEALARQLGLADRVVFSGWVDDLPPVYSDLDVLVNSSLSEGTPTPIMEALVAGCPVVAVNVGGVADLLNNGELGTLVPPQDADALAQAVLHVLDAPPDVTAARAVMLDRYGIDRLLSDMDSLYRGLLAKKAFRSR